MALLASISGVRGTIGGVPGAGLTPLDVVKFAAAYGTWLLSQGSTRKVVVGMDGRPSGPMVHDLVCATLNGLGLHVVSLGLTTTPTVEIAVPLEQAAGGIVITASHNPIGWNALKLLNARGEFISGAEGDAVLASYQKEDFQFAEVEQLGRTRMDGSYLHKHIEQVLALELVDRSAIAQAGLKVTLDAVNSSGGVYVPELLRALGVMDIAELNCKVTGRFAHNPEPLPEHLGEIRERLSMAYAHDGRGRLGIVVDPDVDRLVLVCEDGSFFGEEYTLVAVADYVLSRTPGPAVSNLSSSRALRDICLRHGTTYSAAAVGEVNVVAEMKRIGAVIGGEGNGGIIYPKYHYGRDALVGIALVLSHVARSGKTLLQLKAEYPNYAMAKTKVELTPGMDVDGLLRRVAEAFADRTPDVRDGVKIDWPDRWAHLRKSNTEPIIRIYAEAPTEGQAHDLAAELHAQLLKLS